MALGHIYRVTQDLEGNAVTGVLGTLTLSGTSTLASIYADAAGTIPLPNPTINNAQFGSFDLYATVGTYDMQFVKAGYVFETQRAIALVDPASVVTTITGTANRVLVSPPGGVGPVTLSTPQDIAPDSYVQFASLGLGTPATGNSLTVNGNASFGGGTLSASTVAIAGGNAQLTSLQVDSPTFIVNNTIHGVGIGTVPVFAGFDVNATSYFRLAMGIGAPPVPGSYILYTDGGNVFHDGDVTVTGLFNSPNVAITGGNAQLASLSVDTPTFVVNNTLHAVGIGTVPVFAGLDVNATSYFRNAVGIGAAPDPGVHILKTSGGNVYLDGAVGIGGLANPSYRLFVAGGNVLIGSSRALGVGIAPLWQLHVENSAAVPGGVWVNSTSLATLKRDIAPLQDAIDVLKALTPRRWWWAEDQPDLEALMPGEQAGFVVEEVQAVKPEWTPANSEGTPGLAMRGLEAYLVAAVQQILTRLDAVEAACTT